MKRVLISLLPLAVTVLAAVCLTAMGLVPEDGTLVVLTLAPLVLMGLLSQLPALRERPALAGGFLGVASMLVLAFEARGWGWLSLGVAIGAGFLFERAALMTSPEPNVVSRVFLGSAALAACVSALLAPPDSFRPPVLRLGEVEIPALAASTRDRLGDVEVFTQHVSDDLVSISVGTPPTGTPCIVRDHGHGQHLNVFQAGTEVIVDWSIDPHGEIQNGCTFDRQTGAFLRAEPRPRPIRASERLPLHGIAFLVTLLSALGSARLRLWQARIARSPEVEANEQGVVSMPDGSLAVLGTPLRSATTIIALRTSDRLPGTSETAAYRSDARVLLEEWVAGRKSELLGALTRRIHTLELGGATAAVFVLVAAWLIR